MYNGSCWGKISAAYINGCSTSYTKGGMHMDLVITRLSSIETAAVKIIEAADNEKKTLEQQMNKRIQAFDEETEKATRKKLDLIRSRLNDEMQTNLADLQTATEDTIRSIENDYEMNHKKLAAEIIEKMIEE